MLRAIGVGACGKARVPFRIWRSRVMTKPFAIALAAALLAAGPASAACKLEAAAPAIPSGASATAEEMQATQAAVKSYMGATQEYMQCLEFEAKRDSGAMTQYNAASKSMEALAKQFNAALKDFKARG